MQTMTFWHLLLVLVPFVSVIGSPAITLNVHLKNGGESQYNTWEIGKETFEKGTNGYSMKLHIPGADTPEFNIQNIEKLTFYVETAAMVTETVPEKIKQHATKAISINSVGPVTKICYPVLSDNSMVSVTIYDLSGEHIKTLREGLTGKGRHTTAWNGTNILGKPVSHGPYLACIKVNDKIITKTFLHIN